jgi:hypothetical protein
LNLTFDLLSHLRIDRTVRIVFQFNLHNAGLAAFILGMG